MTLVRCMLSTRGFSQRLGYTGKFQCFPSTQRPLHKLNYLSTAPFTTSSAVHSKVSSSSKVSSESDHIKLKVEDTPLAVHGIVCLTKLYDFMTFPIYALTRRKLPLTPPPYAVKTEGKNEWRSTLSKCGLSIEMEENKIDTLEKLFAYAVKKYGDKKCLGTRPLISQDDGIGLLRKKELGDYQWKTYKDIDQLTDNLSWNMRHVLGLKERETIAIFSDTREEWLLSAFAAFKANLAVATIFTALSDEGVVHAANETEVSCLFTSDDLLPRCLQLLGKMPRIKNIIYMEKVGSKLKLDSVPASVTVQPLSPLFKAGKGETSKLEGNKPRPDDPSIIMHTSGSSGLPKGVILSHNNAISNLKGTADSLDTFHAHFRLERKQKNNYLAYLPLAHIFELTAEALSLIDGCEIGYGTPTTLTDASPGLWKGSKGDATLLKPTNLIVVPLILEKLYKTIEGKVMEKGGILPHLIHYFISYKSQWRQRGYATPLLDKILFSKMNILLGGEVRLMICGGAPLAPETQEFVRAIFCPHLNPGYGLTETSGCTASYLAGDFTLGRAGAPTTVSTFRLVDWEEGGYRVTDKPFPRGELIVGGEAVAQGYFKRPDNKDIFVEGNVRYMRTGDIVEIHDDGAIRIVDRKKDLVKLAQGEFVSLGKIETNLKLCPLIENVCVHANSLLARTVAIVVPSEIEINKLAKPLGKTGDFRELLNDPEIVQTVLTRIQEHGQKMRLSKIEIPKGVHLTPELWTPQNGLVTASLKLKRTNIHNKFRVELDKLCSN